jgi:O-antigen ligase
MKISSDKLGNFVIGCLIMVPLNFYVLGTQIFYVQTALIFFLFILLVFGIKKTKVIFRSGSLTADVSLYVGWVILSFILNFAFSFDSIEFQARRLISMGIALLLMSGFFIGNHLSIKNTESMVRGVLFAYAVVLLYIAVVFVSQSSLDLYVVKEIIGQRLPFVVAYVTILAAAYFFIKKPRQLFYLVIMTAGAMAVVFSLTRAAYIQIFISFFILFMNEIRKYFFRGLIIITIFFFAGFIFYQLFGEYPSVKQITSRIELLLDVKAQSQEDVSGSFRVEMWKFLAKKLISDPTRLIIGYGQLGPTHVAREFVSSDGTTGNNAHSQYLDIVVREGLVGLFLFLWICYKALRVGLSARKYHGDARLFLFANSIALAGVMFYSFFHETFRYPLFGFYFWLFLGMLSKILDANNVEPKGSIN